MNEIFIGDCLEIMPRLIADGIRVQTVVTSPPYYGLRDYGVAGQIGLEGSPQEYVARMVEVFRLVRELLADDGTLWLNLGDSYAGSGRGGHVNDTSTLQGGIDHQQESCKARGSQLAPGLHTAAAAAGNIGRAWVAPPLGFKQKDLLGMPWRVAFALQADGWYLRQDIIWAKPNPMPESVRDRCTKAHEYLFLLARSERYYYDAGAIKEPASANTHARRAGNGKPPKLPAGWAIGDTPHNAIAHQTAKSHRKVQRNGDCTKNNASFDDAMASMPDMANKRSVWTVPSQPFPEAHFATYPPALIRPCILAGSRPGDVVFDPFMGSGTTAQVAMELGRQFLGCELNPEYHAIAQRRLRTSYGLPLTHAAEAL